MFFILSKLFGLLFRPLTLCLLGLALGISLRRWTRWRRLGVGLSSVSMMALFLAEYTTLGAMALQPLENRFPPPRQAPAAVDGIIVLGGAVLGGVLPEERNQVQLNAAAERMTEAVSLARRYPYAPLAFTGFSDALLPKGWSEAEGARRFFQSMGVDVGRIVLEGRARNTAENAVLLKESVQPQPGQRWLLVTSAAHMPRAVGVFHKAGWGVVPWPVDYQVTPRVSFQLVDGGGLRLVSVAMHEWTGLLVYWFTDRTHMLFPEPVFGENI